MDCPQERSPNTAPKDIPLPVTPEPPAGGDGVEQLVAGLETRQDPWPLSKTIDLTERSQGGEEESHNKKNGDNSSARDPTILQPQPREEGREESEKWISAVRECNWVQFMNRFSRDEPIYAVDILVSGYSLQSEIADERERRKEQEPNREPPVPKPDDWQRVHRLKDDKPWIQRVRIQSKPLLQVFSRVTGDQWGSKPHTFFRPFEYLLYYHDQIKDELQRMEGEQVISEPICDSQQSLHSETVESTPPTTSSQKPESEIKERSPKNDVLNGGFQSTTVLEDLRCYVKFIDDRLMPEFNAFQSIQEPLTTVVRVRFDDLWYLFRHGDLVFVPQKTLDKGTWQLGVAHGMGFSHESCMWQNIWRIGNIRIQQQLHPDEIVDIDSQERVKFVAGCYYIDYNGSIYGAVGLEFDIAHFEGEKDVRDLEFFPLRFADGHRQILDAAKDIGRQYTEKLSEWHLLYTGWSLTTSAHGIPYLDNTRVKSIRWKPFHINSEVIIDFTQAFNAEPQFQVDFTDYRFWGSLRLLMGATRANPDRLMIWDNEERQGRPGEAAHDVLVDRTDVELAQDDAFSQTDRYLIPKRRSGKTPEGDDLALLPRRLFAYSLKERFFFAIDVRHLRSRPTRQDAFETLQLPERDKRLILAAVESHLRRQKLEREIQRQFKEDLCTQDFIPGKGRGLSILLHGEPGVGKTATAEAIAQLTGRPLLSINCAGAINTMERVFYLAHVWDCVLLLDEAEVFLRARSQVENSYESSNISEFLRKIEYYNGIMFLTTNRVGKMDPAITSRLHIILHYRRLDPDTINRIFLTNIDRLREAEKQQSKISGEPSIYIMEKDILRFAADHCLRHPDGRGAWNGRQIRNAFIVASSLARDEARREAAGSDFTPQLRYEHFQEVERMTEEFNRFRVHIFGRDDSKQAKMNEERDDDFVFEADTAALKGQSGLGPSRISQFELAKMAYTSGPQLGHQMAFQGMRAPSTNVGIGIVGPPFIQAHRDPWVGSRAGPGFASEHNGTASQTLDDDSKPPRLPQ